MSQTHEPSSLTNKNNAVKNNAVKGSSPIKTTLIKANFFQCLDVLNIRQHVGHKIGYGYALALGTAITGTALGLVLGNYYSYQAQQRVRLYTEKKQLLNELNSQILSIRMHPLRLIATSNDSIWRQFETNQFTTDFKHLNDLLTEIEQFARIHVHSLDPKQPLKTLSKDYTTVLKQYDIFIQTLWQQVAEAESKSDATQQITTALGDESKTQLSLNFQKLSEKLIRLRQKSHQQQKQAEVDLRQAELLRLTIVLTSLILSVGLAIALAIITSRNIAKPIEQVTAIAQEVTESANFDIKVPVHTEDEVALLAQALNQLISWAGQYTQELQQARNTLEQRVQDRTQALQQSETQLRQKADTLQQTLIELQQTQLQLIESEKLSSLGQMVAGIAHELNNPVGFIYGNLKHAQEFTEDLFALLDLYQHHYPDPEEEIEQALDEIDLEFVKEDFPSLMDSMSIGTERIKEIVLSLRTFSRLDEAEIKVVDIHQSLDSTLTILQSRLMPNQKRSAITVIKSYGKLPPVECYAREMNQALMNVLNNAIDALDENYAPANNQLPKETMPEPGESAQRATPERDAEVERIIEIVTEVVDDKEISIQITDNGPGMSEAAQGHLFDPFFTTKEVGDGTGMGLSTSHQIITQRHRGLLTYRSEPNQGTTFTIQIPLKLYS